MTPGSLSKPPPSASRPPHRASASIRDKDTNTEALDCEAVKAAPVRTVAFGLTASTRVLCIFGMLLVWAHRLGTFRGIDGAFFARSVQKTEGKREKATASLTVAFLR